MEKRVEDTLKLTRISGKSDVDVKVAQKYFEEDPSCVLCGTCEAVPHGTKKTRTNMRSPKKSKYFLGWFSEYIYNTYMSMYRVPSELHVHVVCVHVSCLD